MKLVDGEKLLRAIKVMSPVSNYAPEKVPPMNKLVEKEDVLLFIRNCPVSPAQLAEIIENHVQEKAIEILPTEEEKDEADRLIRKDIEDRKKARAWEELKQVAQAQIGDENYRVITNRDIGSIMDELLAQSKTPPTAEEGKKDDKNSMSCK